MLSLAEGAFKFMEEVNRYGFIYSSDLNGVEDKPGYQLWRAHLYCSRGLYYNVNPSKEYTPEMALQAYAEAVASTKDMVWNKDTWPIISKIYIAYGNCLSDLERHPEAIEAYEKAYEVHCSFTSPADRTVQLITARLASALRETGDVERAEYFSQVAYENVRDHHVNESVESACYFAEVRCQALFAAVLRSTNAEERVRLFIEGDKVTESALAALGSDHPLREAKLLFYYQEMVPTLRLYSSVTLHRYVGRRLAILRDVLPPTPETRRSLVCQYARSAFLYEKFHNECFITLNPDAVVTIPMVCDATSMHTLDWAFKNLVKLPVSLREQVTPEKGYDRTLEGWVTKEGEPAALLPLRHLRVKPLNDVLLALVIAAEEDFLVLFWSRTLLARSAMRLAVEGAVYGNN
jgi:tetratricopeptide (TPR) repeat protein